MNTRSILTAHRAKKQLVDMSGLTGVDTDFTELMKLQARKADVFAAGAVQTLIVYYAPNDVGMGIARLIERSWQDIDAVVPIIQNNEADALELLGQPERSMRELMQKVS